MVFNTSCAPLNYKASHEPETFDASVVVDAVLLCGFAASASGCDRLGDYSLPGTLQKRNSSHKRNVVKYSAAVASFIGSG